MPPDRAGDVAAALRHLIDHIPHHPHLLSLQDAGVADGDAYVVFSAAPGEPLDAALRTYGPADLHDALPRLAQLASALDAAAAHGRCHGSLTTADVIVSADETFLAGVGVAGALQQAGCQVPVQRPYAAPEVIAAGTRGQASDEFALAAIAYEWLFGKPAGDAARDETPRDPEVPLLPGVDQHRMRSVFARAFAHEPGQRFASCSALIEAIEATTRPAVAVPPPVLGDLPIYPDTPAAEHTVVHAAPRFAAVTREHDARPPVEISGLGGGSRLIDSSSTDSTQQIDATDSRLTKRVIVAAVLVGSVALGALWFSRLARDKSPAVGDASPGEGQAFTEAPVASGPAPVAESPVVRPPEPQPSVATNRDDTRRVSPATDVARVAQVDAGLLVHSTPEGASVSIDGTEHGVTPVAVRGLALGVRTVVVSRPGYRPAQRQVTLTSDRPSRTLEVGLARMAVPASAPSAARDGALVVDSRPAGATVTIDGRAAGVTPLMVSAIAPGSHTVRIERPGYRPVSTTVVVTAGQRARVAARLEGGQEEE